MSFLPNGKLLVTEKAGKLLLVDINTGTQTAVAGVPTIAYGGQGGLADVILHPEYPHNQLIYLSYAEEGPKSKRGGAVARAYLNLATPTPSLQNLEVVWRQQPKVSGKGHYSLRLAFGPKGFLFISSGERQKKKPAQSWQQNLGKIIRLHADGAIPANNPFQNHGALAKSFWSLGHRNPLGIAFNQQGLLWANEMGPRHGDELNLINKGDNYGWPIVSWDNNYSGIPITDHDKRPEFHAPEAYWVPSITPSSLVFYSGSLFTGWQANALIGGLRSKALIRVGVNGQQATELERFDMGERIREVEQGPAGAIWMLEDAQQGRLLRITPRHH